MRSLIGGIRPLNSGDQVLSPAHNPSWSRYGEAIQWNCTSFAVSYRMCCLHTPSRIRHGFKYQDNLPRGTFLILGDMFFSTTTCFSCSLPIYMGSKSMAQFGMVSDNINSCVICATFLKRISVKKRSAMNPECCLVRGVGCYVHALLQLAEPYG